MTNTLFKPNERLLVEEKFLDTAAYDFLKGACERLMDERCNDDLPNVEGGLLEHGESEARLHPAELFYQCFFILDTLKCKKPTLRVAYCNERAWDELSGYFRDNGFSWSLARQQLIIGSIIQGTAELLLRASREHLSEAAALKRLIQRHAPLLVKALDQAYRSSLRSMDEEELVCMMGEYMEAEEKMYSEEINEWLDELVDAAESGITKEDASDANQLTNRQVVIMMAGLLDISLSPEYTNQKQLAQFLSRLTGRSEQSIRQTIMSLAKTGIETPQARKDSLVAAEVLEPVCGKVASRLRNDAEE